MSERSGLVSGGNAFVLAYAADAAISIADTLLSLGAGVTALGPLRNVVAMAVVLAALVGLVVLAATPRLPFSVFGPLVLSALWFLIGAPPLGLFLAADVLFPLACFLQGAIAAAAFLRIRALNGGRGWLLRPDALRGPGFSARHTLVFGGTLVLLAVPLVAFSLLSSVMAQIEAHTSGFVVFDADGVSLEDRRYVRGDDEIRLVGMMHIGEPEAYRGIFESFVRESTLVLAEGVSDDHGVMEQNLSYEGVARALGLEQQQYVTAYLPADENGERSHEWPVVRNADLDASDFAPETLEALERIRRVWASDRPLVAFAELVLHAEQDSELWRAAIADILDRRNDHLVAQIDASLGEFRRIVVPWGALHLPVIEAAVVERGFEPTTSERHRLISWATLLAALAG